MERREASNELNKSLNSVGLRLEGAPKVIIPKTLSAEILAAKAIAMSEDMQYGFDLANIVTDLRQSAIRTLKDGKSFPLVLDIPNLADPNYEPTPADIAPSLLAASLGSFAIVRIAMPNSDHSISQLYGTTTPRTNIDEGELQFTYIGLRVSSKSGYKWESPAQIDPLRPDLVSPADMETYLSGANQLGLVGDHDNSGIKVSDPRHLINLLHGLANPGLSGHWADALESNGQRKLLTETSAKRIIAPNEFGDSLYQDPLNTTPVFTIGAERIPMAIVLAPELMEDIDSLETRRSNKPGSLETLQGMALAARFAQRLGDSLDRAIPKSGMI